MPQTFQDFPQNLQISYFWLRMSSKYAQSRKLFVNLLSHSDIRKQHKLLNEIICLNKLIHSNIGRIMSFLLECNFNLRRRQSQSPLLISPLLQLLGNIVQISNRPSQRSFIVGVHQLLSLHVGKGSSRTDYGLAISGFYDICLSVYLPNRGKGQSIHVGPQGAQILRQKFRKHISPSINQINSGTPVSGLQIERRIGSHIIADISDMHSNFQIAIRQLNAVQGIINILAPRGVDAADVQIPQILSVLQFFLRDGEFLAGRRQAGVGSFAELFDFDIMLQKDGVCLGSGVTNRTNGPDVVGQSKSGASRPPIKANNDPLVSKLVDVESSHIEVVEFAISRHKFINFVLGFVFVLHVFVRFVGWGGRLQSAAVEPVGPLRHCHYSACWLDI